MVKKQTQPPAEQKKGIEPAEARFTKIFENEKRAVFSSAYYILGKKEDAEEIAQSVFIKLWEKRNSIDEIENITAWLKRTAVNLSIDRLRSVKRLKRTPIFNFEDDFRGSSHAGENLINSELLENVLGAVKTLPPLERAAILLHTISGMTANEIAGQFGTAPSTVRNQILQARRKINDIVKKKYEKR